MDNQKEQMIDRRSISMVRTEAKNATKHIEDPVKKNFKTQKELFNRLYSDQITIEVAVKLLESGEYYYWREYNKKPDDVLKDIDREIWQKYKVALDGARGNGSIEDTISFFQDYAEDLEDTKQIISGKSTPFFGALELRMGEALYLDHVIANYKTAAKLFESNQNLKNVLKID